MQTRHWRLLAVGAACLAVLVAWTLRDTPGYISRQADGTTTGDIQQYVAWTRLVTVGGLHSAYDGSWPDTYAVYGPVTLFGYAVAGQAYRLLVDPSFDLAQAEASGALFYEIKAVAVGWHLLTASALYVLVERRFGSARAFVSLSAYVLNPAALYDVAVWAQPDGAHSLFTLLSVGFISYGSSVAAGAALALAALAKPQAWALLPLIVFAGWRLGGWHSLRRGVMGAAAMSIVVIAPFVIFGRLPQLLSLPGTIVSTMPVVTANATNFWWLVLAARGLDPLSTPDTTRLVGPLTYRVVAAILVLGVFGLSYGLYWTRRMALAEAAAFGALGWFSFTTQAHENHLFFALPLLALAWPEKPRLSIIFAILTVTILANLVLEDIVTEEALGLDPGGGLAAGLRSANAIVNLACFAGWLATAVLRRRRRGLGPSEATPSTDALAAPSVPFGPPGSS